jgi:hypothetical protein
MEGVQIGEIDDSFKYFFGIKTLKIVQCSCRFVQIKPYPHFSDDAGNNQGDKLRKIRFILDHCRDKFQSEYVPHREISVDEAMII